MRNALLILAAVFVGAACSDGTGPGIRPPAATVIFADSLGHVSMVRSGGAPAALRSLDTTTLFATTTGGVIGLKFGQLYSFRLSDPIPRPFESLNNLWSLMTRGAVSPDGKRLAYGSANDAAVFLHTIELESGTHDSVNLSSREEILAAPQIIYSYPIWSPSGDWVAFLLPNVVGIQILLYERLTRRVEVKPMAVPTSTYFHVLDGWPRWTEDGAIRFLTRRMEVEPWRLLDTLVVLQVHPRDDLPFSEVVARAVAPDSLPMSDPWSYSFSADGKTIAFGMSTNGRAAIMVMRQGQRELETLLYGPGGPRSLVLVPD